MHPDSYWKTLLLLFFFGFVIQIFSKYKPKKGYRLKWNSLNSNKTKVKQAGLAIESTNKQINI
jgi:hypothetical protein